MSEPQATTPPPVERRGFVSIPTIGRRLDDLMWRLGVAASALCSADPFTETQDILRGVHLLVIDAREQGYWLTTLPAEVLQLPAPDGDDKDEIEEVGGYRTFGPRLRPIHIAGDR